MFRVGDKVKLSEIGLSELNQNDMAISKRVSYTRLLNNGGKVSQIYNNKISVEIFDNTNSPSGTWILDEIAIGK